MVITNFSFFPNYHKKGFRTNRYYHLNTIILAFELCPQPILDFKNTCCKIPLLFTKILYGTNKPLFD